MQSALVGTAHPTINDFTSWEGLGVDSSSIFPVPCSLFPVPYSLKPRTLYLTQLKTAIVVFNFQFSKKNEPDSKLRC
ncbi:hypothetical protein [Moorena bouillonii]|uniref:hypothetical protein n=1 Tax=Moorena bouillonii TaxID=207920 RepID=UPI0018E953E5|nr:hypothetical protein [Moorena bouillonii]